MTLFTIGHSTHSERDFVSLLRRQEIVTVADVRSHPWSRRNPQFRKRELERSLAEHGLEYLFLGRELGARSEDPQCFEDGRVSYARLARRPAFRVGIERLLACLETGRTALMCAERDPLACHRMILVCREIRNRVDGIAHILADGTLEINEQTEHRLMRLHRLAPDMLRDMNACIDHAYDLQAVRIAPARTGLSPEGDPTP